MPRANSVALIRCTPTPTEPVRNDIVLTKNRSSSARSTSLSSPSPGNISQRLDWIKLIGCNGEFRKNVFVMTEDGGILCDLCREHGTKNIRGGYNQFQYSQEPAHPKRCYQLSDHLTSGIHLDSIAREPIKRHS